MPPPAAPAAVPSWASTGPQQDVRGGHQPGGGAPVQPKKDIVVPQVDSYANNVAQPKKDIVVPQAYVRSSCKSSFKGQQLERIDWHGISIVPVMKEFLLEHPETQARSLEECERMRLNHSIQIVSGEDIPKPIESFQEVPFPDSIVEVLQEQFTRPTSIQVQAWPVLLKGNDLIGIACTGSGKTLAYVLPMLIHILAQPELRPCEGPVGLILVPHRELCEQVQREIQSFIVGADGRKRQDLRCEAVHGGAGIKGQADIFLERCDIVISTPGRLIHLLKEKDTNLCRATFVVLDEADNLLEHEFAHQIRLIMSQVRPDRQVCMFSATWPESMENLAKDVCTCKPIHIHVGSMKVSACKDIHQVIYQVGESKDCAYPGASKLEALALELQKLVHSEDLKKRGNQDKVLIFVNRNETVVDVADYLRSRENQLRDFKCEPLSSCYPQQQREAILNKFRDGAVHFLVCTSLLGRGHDFPGLRYVINFDMPRDIVEYVHRIGRTGRGGEQGFSWTFFEEKDMWTANSLVACLKETLNSSWPQTGGTEIF